MPRRHRKGRHHMSVKGVIKAPVNIVKGAARIVIAPAKQLVKEVKRAVR